MEQSELPFLLKRAGWRHNRGFCPASLHPPAIPATRGQSNFRNRGATRVPLHAISNERPSSAPLCPARRRDRDRALSRPREFLKRCFIILDKRDVDGNLDGNPRLLVYRLDRFIIRLETELILSEIYNFRSICFESRFVI